MWCVIHHYLIKKDDMKNSNSWCEYSQSVQILKERNSEVQKTDRYEFEAMKTNITHPKIRERLFPIYWT